LALLELKTYKKLNHFFLLLGDILKWRKSNVSRVTFADIAEVSLEECKKRNQEPFKSDFKSSYVLIDATTDSIKKLITDETELKHDLVSCQFVIHYSFETYEKAYQFLRNVNHSLKVGGFFIGTTTNANEIVKRLRESATDSFGNELYKIKFFQKDKDNFDLFGVKFDFQLGFESDQVVNVPEYLLNFEILVKLAEKNNLKLVMKKTFNEYFEENCLKDDYKPLINIIKALEPYYSKSSGIMDASKTESSEYEFINSKLEDDNYKNDLEDDEIYMTLSKSEWEAINLYLVFAFQKIDDLKD
jgi:mRNA (guanine-N7-)-methyltransferase